jgi:hypothetical protein
MHYSDTQLKGIIMDRLKQLFREDPMLAIGVTIAAASAAAVLLTAVSKIVESSAYAYRASKL